MRNLFDHTENKINQSNSFILLNRLPGLKAVSWWPMVIESVAVDGENRGVLWCLKRGDRC